MRLVIHGVVQGVGFRPTVHRIATDMGLDGRVRNDGGRVVVEVDGGHRELLQRIMEELPPLASVESVELIDKDYRGPKGFSIMPSSAGAKGAGIPVDTAVCPSCLEEMSDPDDRRYGYPFTNCTDCGARFTLISDLPYDRAATALDPFPPCEDCRGEYASPGDRRFHHQTVCCPRCGPRYRLVHGGEEQRDRPVQSFAALLRSGCIGVAKSWGGMHICSTLDSLPRLREWYRREEKPFAVMVKDLDAARRFADPSEAELEALGSAQRPIVLVPKREGGGLDQASPGLDNVGLFLPYAGMQHLLFKELGEDALVMTSANVPGEPMMLDDGNVMSLGADAYLLHDQRILNRADDSVLRVYDGEAMFIRRSRGHTPAWMPAPGEGSVLALGAQENIAGAVAHGGRLYSTQHIGDADHIGVLDYLDDSLAHLRRLLDMENVDAVAMDMHPGYSNRRLGRRLGEENGVEPLEVQHHWAHAASLLVDNQVDAAAVLALDGSGYGDDGKAWGGEVLLSSLDGYRRVGHLRPFPLLGGEKAVHDIRRLCYAIDRMSGRENNMFDDKDSRVLDIMMGNSVETSSLGRVMDALSCYLGVCGRRSYDGEPAMKLESLLDRGMRAQGFGVTVSGGEVDSVSLLAAVMDSALRPEDKAYTVVSCLVDSMVDMAVDAAQREGLEHIGLSGGVSYNSAVCDIARRRIEGRGMKLLRHRRVPNGDGGVAVGQAAIALRRSG